jgi:serine/threonine protein kinase
VNPPGASQPASPLLPSMLMETNAEPIPGYVLLERLGRGGYGEVWKCEAPGGLYKAIKIVHGDLSSLEEDNLAARQELQALQRVKLIRHPFVLSMERLEVVHGRLIIVTELADKNLHEVQFDHRLAGRPGIPRAELLAYLREAAEALDWMNHQFGLQHLDIKPRNLFLVSKHVKVADFGLVTSLWETGAKGSAIPFMGMTTPPYSAPEVFRGAVSPYSDQYSLAIVYQELLTGVFPFRGKNARQLAMQHDQAEPDLSPLPPADRSVMARALTKDPRQRFPSCTALIAALFATGAGPEVVCGVEQTPPVSGSPTIVEVVSRRAPDHSAVRSAADHMPETPASGRNAAGLEEVAPAVGEFRAGLEFLACLDHSPLCEVWKVRGTDGRLRMARFIHGFGRLSAGAEKEAVERLAFLAHPALAKMEVARHGRGTLILAGDLPGATLAERFQEYRAQGLPGLPRWELLEGMRRAAEALDYLQLQHGIQHLGLNPNNILVTSDQWFISDAGLMHLFWSPAGHAPFQLNALYSAPELFEKQAGSACDQYSLALIYLEMLTGRQPHLGRSPRQLARLRREGKLNLDQLPASDRPILTRALHPDPVQRYESCVEMVNALHAVTTDHRPLVRGLPPVISSAWSALPAGLSGPVPSPEQVVTQLLASATGSSALQDGPSGDALAPNGQGHTRFQAELTPEQAAGKLEDFCRQWHGKLVCATDDLLVCHLGLPRGFWHKYLGRPMGLELHVVLAATAARHSRRDVSIEFKVFGCEGKRAEQLLGKVGPVLIQSLRDYFQTKAEQRGRRRLMSAQPLKIYPVIGNFELGQPVECLARDVSLSGVGFLSPQALTSSQIYLNPAPTGQGVLVAILAQVVRMQRRDDGQFDVGAFFKLDEPEFDHPS